MTVKREYSNGSILVSGYFDEFTGAPVVDSSLVLWLDAGQTSSYPGSGTTWTDLSGNGNNGTLINGPTFDSSNGGSIVIDGSNDYVTCGTYQFNSAQGTIAFWFKPTTNITASVAKRVWGNNGDFEARWNTGNGGLTIDLGNSLGTIITNTTSWLNTVWYNVILTWDSSVTTGNIYVQGELDGTGTTASTATLTALTGTFYIGRSVTAQYLNANISNFMAYDRALTATEVLQNFNALRGRYGI